MDIKKSLISRIEDMEKVAILFDLLPIYFLGGSACLLGDYTQRAKYSLNKILFILLQIKMGDNHLLLSPLIKLHKLLSIRELSFKIMGFLQYHILDLHQAGQV